MQAPFVEMRKMGEGVGAMKHMAKSIHPRIFLGPHSSGPIRHHTRKDLPDTVMS